MGTLSPSAHHQSPEGGAQPSNILMSRNFVSNPFSSLEPRHTCQESHRVINYEFNFTFCITDGILSIKGAYDPRQGFLSLGPIVAVCSASFLFLEGIFQRSHRTGGKRIYMFI